MAGGGLLSSELFHVPFQAPSGMDTVGDPILAAAAARARLAAERLKEYRADWALTMPTQETVPPPPPSLPPLSSRRCPLVPRYLSGFRYVRPSIRPSVCPSVRPSEPLSVCETRKHIT